MKRAVPLLLLLLATGCTSTLKNSRVRPDYESVDRARLKRLVVVTAPAPAEPEQLGELWSRIARRYVNQKRNFIVKAHTSLPGRADAAELKRLCAEAAEGLEGVLLLEPTELRRVGSGKDAGVEEAVHARLLRCSDGQEVWSANAAGSFESDDAQLKESATLWTNGLSPSVEPYAAPAFRLLRPTLDSLPEPTPPATDEETMEKGDAELF